MEDSKKEVPESKKKILVTSSKTIDFPSLDWSIRADETRELPEGKKGEEILKNHFINIKK